MFTVLFDGAFWIGVLERHDNDGVRAVKVTFGPEPTQPELHAWLLANGNTLLDRLASAQPVTESGRNAKRVNPKRAMREAARAAQTPRLSTTAQQALAAEREARHDVIKEETRRAQREAQDQQWLRRRQRVKVKRRGR